MAKGKYIEIEIPDKILHLPLIPIREIVIFPPIEFPFRIGRPKSLAALQQSIKQQTKLFLVTQKHAEIEVPAEKDLYKVGIVGKIVRHMEEQKGVLKIIFQGQHIAAVDKFNLNGPYPQAKVKLLPKPLLDCDEDHLKNSLRRLKLKFKSYAAQTPELPPNLVDDIQLEIDPLLTCYRLLLLLPLSVASKQKILESESLTEVMEMTYNYLAKFSQAARIKNQFNDRIGKIVISGQKGSFFEKKLREFQQEATKDLQSDEIAALKAKIKKLKLPKHAATASLAEIKKLGQMMPLSSESSIVRNYLNWLFDMPWHKRTKDNISIANASKILAADHYGLSEVKENILDFIALAARNKNPKGPILCFSGPPGVGKTSLAKSIARALGRNFVRMSLGGIRDEADIRGHRRTYIGAMPGKIIAAMKKAKSINPLILLDEVDKVMASHMGDPAAALLEALDPEQNYAFIDHYLEIEYDLSQVMFVCTANVVPNIPHALRDRMEIIELIGYSETEKSYILKKHLLPKKLQETGLKESTVQLPLTTVREMIRSFTKEAGIRDLERQLARVLRKANRELLSREQLNEVKISKTKLYQYLGPAKFKSNQLEKASQVGLANGLAWTSYGGVVLVLEVLALPGKGKLILTGKLGQVMQESAQAAHSFVRANAQLLGIDDQVFSEKDLHVHATEGAIPKDGPSAGVTLATAIVSALTKIPVANKLAMTGEVTLRGRVLAVGGIKEKLLAASRAKIKQIFIPRG